jgi:hypothetical protein
MEVTYSIRDDGQVDAHVGPDLPLFNEALSDSISSLPPRGATGNGPSTYWIDIAEAGARRAAELDDETPFTSGNVTFLQVTEGRVIAAYDFADEDEPRDAIPLHDFLELLAGWREQVLAQAADNHKPLPETYRRNPAR